MPQISKIRIVNFNYNDGNRFIPDELYDLASPDTGKALNTLFNLNNGGGKTVLVQLMMQPVHQRQWPVEDVLKTIFHTRVTIRIYCWNGTWMEARKNC